MNQTNARSPFSDLATLILTPTLIMLMVGSLVYTLIEVLYNGKYEGRLVWTFFFFTMGTVLIARITIEQGRDKAAIYAAALGAACFIAMMSFVDYPAGPMKSLAPLINLVLMGLVWFAADRLTWDCTHFDEARKASGRGVLAAAGLDDFKQTHTNRNEPEDDDDVQLTKKQRHTLSWTQRWEAYRKAKQAKPHTPGVRILYFGLGALPLFALGQSLVPSDDTERRTTMFYLMVLYIFSTLALLVTTSLMGLTRYLEERGAPVSNRLTLGWLGMGGLLIFLFLIVGAFLPRPHNETPLLELSSKTTSERKASKNAILRDENAGEGEGRKGTKTDPNGREQTGQSKQSEQSSHQKDKPSDGQKNGASKSGKGDNQAQQKSSSKDQQTKGERSERSQDNQQSKSPQQDQQDKQNQQTKETSQGNQNSKQDQVGNQKGSTEQGEQEPQDSDQSKAEAGNESASSQFSQMFEQLGNIVKWIVWVIIILTVIFAFLFAILKGLAPFTNWAQSLLDWWRSLWHRKATNRITVPQSTRSNGAMKQQLPPFDEFRNPFARGSTIRTPAEIVRYTVSALESWAAERGLGREDHETPVEFIIRLGREYPEIDNPGYETIQLFLRAIYSQKLIAPADLKPAQTLWQALEELPRPGQANQPV